MLTVSAGTVLPLGMVVLWEWRTEKVLLPFIDVLCNLPARATGFISGPVVQALQSQHTRQGAQAGESTSSCSVLGSTAEVWGRNLLPASTHGNGMSSQPRFLKSLPNLPAVILTLGKSPYKGLVFPEGEGSPLSERGGS